MSAATKSLLIVDDEAPLRESLAKVFRREGYRVGVAAGGTVAVQMCREHQFDLVLMDWQMPGGGGTNLLRALDERHPWLPIIVVTGAPAQVNVDSGSRKPVVMAKPLDLPLLIERVGQLCSGQVTSMVTTRSASAPLATPMSSGLADGGPISPIKPLTSASPSGEMPPSLVVGVALRSSPPNEQGGV